MEKLGMKRVEIKGLKDKELITAVFAVTKDGYLLPPQIIYKGKTSQCLPLIQFMAHHMYRANKKQPWIMYISKVLLPYVERKRH